MQSGCSGLSMGKTSGKNIDSPAKMQGKNSLESLGLSVYVSSMLERNRIAEWRETVKSIKASTLCASLVVIFLATNACSQKQVKLPQGIQWVVNSVEYAALCQQVYRLAWPAVKATAQAQTENWVVVLDVDETVLNNVQYAVERAQIGAGFSRDSWSKWVRREEATPIPGVKAFLDSVRSLGDKAHIAFITNRMFSNEAATIANLKKHGLFEDGDTMLTRKERADTKVMRRQCLESGTGRCAATGPLKIIALFGDNIRDIMPMRGWQNAQHYRDEELPNDPNWGVKYFMLPNPTYGSWERQYK